MALTASQKKHILTQAANAKELLAYFGTLSQGDALWAGTEADYQHKIDQAALDSEPTFVDLTLADLDGAEFALSVIKNTIASQIEHLGMLANLV